MRSPFSTRVALTTALALTMSLAVPALASAAPQLLTPKAGATVVVGSQPLFKVRDSSEAAKKYKVFITISTTRKRTKNGDLKRTEIGTFTSTKRRGSIFRYKPPAYSFPTWYLNRPGTYYWQAYHIDCAVKGCHVHSPIRSFKVRADDPDESLSG